MAATSTSSSNGLAMKSFMPAIDARSRWLGSATPGLKTGGLYRYSRNPQFVAYGALILGAVIAWGNPLGLLGLASYLALAYAVARIEEEHLARIYGQDYLDYCARVPRFVGWPGR